MYNIKEIETTGSKKTGISSMQIKDILKLLIDDGLVNCEKCGISNIYWSFQYTSILKINTEFNKLELKKLQKINEIENLKIELNNLKNERSILKNEEKIKLINHVSKLKDENLKFELILKTLKLNSPDTIKFKINKIKQLEKSIDILVDNIDILVSFILELNTNGMERENIFEFFNIPHELIN